MISGKSCLAIIPARAGSLRCPEKNWTAYRNKSTGEMLPLIAWAIKHAQGSKYIDTICISSDSDIILAYAKPPIIAIRRPAYLSTDSATSEALIVHALYASNLLGENVLPFHDLFCLLQPTSPLRTPADIDSCLQLSVTTNSRVVSVNPDRARNGAVYISPTLKFLSDLSLDRAQSYVMPDARSLDIDLHEHFNL